MSLARQRFLEGFTGRCLDLGIRNRSTITSLLEKAAADALTAVESSYDKQGKAPRPTDQDVLAGSTGVHAYEEGSTEKYLMGT